MSTLYNSQVPQFYVIFAGVIHKFEETKDTTSFDNDKLSQ